MKTVLITGANRGLGAGFVDYFLANDYLVFAGARNPEDFDKELKSNPHFQAVQLDVSDDSSINKAFKTVSEKTNSLNYLINNAGINKDSATNNRKELVSNLKNLDRSSLLKMFDVNAIAPMIMFKTFLPLLTNDPSFVVNISSCRASYHDELENTHANYGYRASKTALNMMTFCSLFDLPANVKTFAVHPGIIKGDMNPKGTDSPVEQAKLIIEISKNWDEKFNGKFLRFDGTIYPT